MSRYRTALVMIARDEAPRIARALASVRAHVDQMWVIDTGSRDDTVAIAQAAGAQVASFEWVDDFAAARNAALEIAQADWHVVLDADEWLVHGGEHLAALRDTPPDHVGALRVDSDFGTGLHAGIAPSWLPRVLPRGVRYAGRVHEQPQHVLPVRRLPVVVGHDGYAPQALALKAGRNAALLARALEQNPADAYLWYQLGKDHDVYERHDDALRCFERAFELAAGDAPWHHDALVRTLHAYKRVGRHGDGMQHAERALAAWQHSPDFFFALGDLLLDWAAEEPQQADQLLPMVEAAWLRCIEIGERVDLEGAVAGRGSHLAAHNLVVLYEGTGRVERAEPLRALAAQRA